MKKIILKIGIVFTVSGLLLFGARAHEAKAASIEGLVNTPVMGDYVVGPGKSEVALNPGEHAVRTLTVTNRYGKDMKFHIEVEDFRGSRDTSEVIVLLGNERGPYSLRDFIKPEVSAFKLKHGDRITIPVVIDVPADASPGGLYGAVIITTEPEAPSESVTAGVTKSNLTVISRLASLFFVRVSGTAKEAGALKDFSTDKKIYQTGKIDFSWLYENSGNVYLNPYGLIKITNLIGTTVDEAGIQPYFVMPDALRQKNLSWQHGFMFGRYQAKIMLNRGYNDVIDEKTVTFWILPWKVLAGIAVAIMAVVLLVAGIKRWFRKNFEIVRKK